MKRNYLWAGLGVLLVVTAAGFFLWRSGIFRKAPAVAPEQEDIWQDVVTYTDKGFEPAEVRIRKGAAVTFMNRSSKSMRPASDPHPAHTDYPVSGGCAGSLFDACSDIPAGAGWSFKFDTAGIWKYHDHLHPAFKGMIVVK